MKEMKEFDFKPVYILEILRTASSGLMATAVSNHLLLELRVEKYIGSIISSMFFFGFLFFTLFLKGLSDKLGRKKLIMLTQLSSVSMGLLTLIPLDTNIKLFLFAIWRFLDGGGNGLFWPTIQSYGIIATKYGKERRNTYLKWYNFGWNFGFLVGMIAGAFFLYSNIIESNRDLFYVNIWIVLIGLSISIFFLKPIPIFSEEESAIHTENLEKENTTKIEAIENLSMISILSVLLIHALFDGAIIIFTPLKSEELLRKTYWIFIFGFVKAISQTFATTSLSSTKKEKILGGLTKGLALIIFVWTTMLFTNNIWLVILLGGFSGLFQGAIYAYCNKLTTYKANSLNSSVPFSHYQATMGSGRMVGQLIIGLGATLIHFNIGIMILLAYDLMALGFFMKKIKKKN